MKPTQCSHLRDFLFASSFLTDHGCEKVFRFLSVEVEMNSCPVVTVHYAYSTAVWERAYCRVNSDQYVESLVAASPFCGDAIKVRRHSYLGGAWPRPWNLTAKEEINNFPVLVLHELVDGLVTGVLMRDSQSSNTIRKFADAVAENWEVRLGIEELMLMPQGAKWDGWYKESNIDPMPLDEAISMAPQTLGGQKGVVVYRSNEWLSGTWEASQGQSEELASAKLDLRSVADLYGVRVSRMKLLSRAGLDIVREKQTLVGDYDCLERSIKHLGEIAVGINCEEDAAVKLLCSWWNHNAPSELQTAGLFRVYIWDEASRTFIAGDPEEPTMQAEDFNAEQCYSVFESEGRPAVVLIFYRGREFNTEGEWGTDIYSPNGMLGRSIGLDPSEVDEAYYSMIGLWDLASRAIPQVLD